MLQKKNPASSLSVIELLVERALYRTLARIRKICSGGVSPETSPTHSSPATRLPLEVVEMIIAYLAYDKRSLFACTLTCRSWYIAAVRYVHRTLTVNINSWDQKFKWKNRIMHMCMSSLFPLVKKFQILGDRDNSDRLSPKLFNHCILYQFSALTNVLDLRIECLDIPKFIPRIKRYFRNFLPTVRSLSLKEPNGSRRQIIYFIGLFQHLQDLELLYDRFGSRDGPADDPTLTPPFAPPLRGWLVMKHVRGVGLLEGMIDLFGGLRFRYIRLRDVDRMPFLLAACAETLEVVVLNPADPRAKSSLRDFDLSQNKSLRTLQVQANLIDRDSRGPASKFLKHVLSTITSPVFSRVIVIYGNQHFRGIEFYHSSRTIFFRLSQAERAGEVARHRMAFEVFHKIHEVRDFQLMLAVCISGSVGEEPVRILEEAVAEEKRKRGFNGFLSDPLVEYNPVWSYP